MHRNKHAAARVFRPLAVDEAVSKKPSGEVPAHIMSSFIKSLGSAAAEHAKGAVCHAASKVADATHAVGHRVSETKVFHLATHHGMTKEEVLAVHRARQQLHLQIMADFISSGKVTPYPAAQEHVDKLLLGLGMLNIAGTVTGLDKLTLAVDAAKLVVSGQLVQQFLGDMFNSGVIDLMNSLQTDDPDWMKRNTAVDEPAALLAMLLLVVKDSAYDPVFHPAAPHAAAADAAPIFPEIEQYALLAQAAYTTDDVNFQDYVHTIFPGFHMLVSLPDEKKLDAAFIAENHPAFRLLANPATRTGSPVTSHEGSAVVVVTVTTATVLVTAKVFDPASASPNGVMS